MSGIYIHIPFCKSRCAYCDFFSTTLLSQREAYVNALCIEAKKRLSPLNAQHPIPDSPHSTLNAQHPIPNHLHPTPNAQHPIPYSPHPALTPIETIYFGGGTPSLLSPDQIARVLQAITTGDAGVSPAVKEVRSPNSTTENTEDAGVPPAVKGMRSPGTTIEITLEANPGDLTADYLRAIRAAGVNRLSIGVQSFDDEVLRLIGRRHTGAEAKAAVAAAQAAGFDNISIDLIYGIPSPTLSPHASRYDGAACRPTPHTHATPDYQLSAWQDQIDQALQLGVQHISAYCLSYEEGTRMARMLEQGEISEVDEETENAMYDLLVSRLQAAGFEHYEVSNFALSNHYSRHNGNYWNRTPYIGLGAGAHSYDGMRTRSWNPDSIEEYIRAMEKGQDPSACEQLTDTDLYNERIMLGLRTAKGIAMDELHNPALATPFIKRGLLQQTADRRLTATIDGIHILNRIIEELME